MTSAEFWQMFLITGLPEAYSLYCVRLAAEQAKKAA